VTPLWLKLTIRSKAMVTIVIGKLNDGMNYRSGYTSSTRSVGMILARRFNAGTKFLVALVA